MTIIIRRIVHVARYTLVQNRPDPDVEVPDARDLGPENMPGSSKSREITRRRYDRAFKRDCLQRRFY